MSAREWGRMGGYRNVARYGGATVSQRGYQGQLAKWRRAVEADAAAQGEVLTPQECAARVAYMQRLHCAKMRAAKR